MSCSGFLLGDSSSIALLESEFFLRKFSSQSVFLRARFAVSNSTSQALDGMFLMADLDGSSLVKVLVARLSDSSVGDDLLQNGSLLLRGSLLDSLVENLDFLSHSLD